MFRFYIHKYILFLYIDYETNQYTFSYLKRPFQKYYIYNIYEILYFNVV